MCQLAATTCWKTCENSPLFCHLRVCWEWLLRCCFFKVWHTGVLFLFLDSAYGTTRLVAQLPLAGQADDCLFSMPRICQFQHLPLNRALKLLATTTTRPQPSTTLDPYLAASRLTPRQARESTQTLQAFYVERHLSACAS